MVCTLLAGVNVVAFAADDNDLIVSVQKFYYDVEKGGNGEHIYTIDEDEISWYKSLPSWNDEGEAWKAPVSSETPVYRVANYNTGEHLWITDKGYVDYLVGIGWTQEQGIAFYSDDNKGVPVYRLWDGTGRVGSHHYSTDAGEISWLESLGWKNEGPQFYGVKGEEPTTKALSAAQVGSDKIMVSSEDGFTGEESFTVSHGDLVDELAGAEYDEDLDVYTITLANPIEDATYTVSCEGFEDATFEGEAHAEFEIEAMQTSANEITITSSMEITELDDIALFVGGVEEYDFDVAISEDGLSAVLTLEDAITESEYTISVTPADETIDPASDTIIGEAAELTDVVIGEELVLQADGTAAGMWMPLDQWGDEIKVDFDKKVIGGYAEAGITYQDNIVSVNAAQVTAQNYPVGTELPVSIVEGTFVKTGTMTVSATSVVADINLSPIQMSEDEALINDTGRIDTADINTQGAYYYIVSAYDQYGLPLTAAQLTGMIDESLIISNVGDAMKMDGAAFLPGPTAGTAIMPVVGTAGKYGNGVINLVSTSGAVATATQEIAENEKIADVNFIVDTLQEGKAKYALISATNQYGEDVDLYNEVTFTPADANATLKFSYVGGDKHGAGSPDNDTSIKMVNATIGAVKDAETEMVAFPVTGTTAGAATTATITTGLPSVDVEVLSVAPAATVKDLTAFIGDNISASKGNDITPIDKTTIAFSDSDGDLIENATTLNAIEWQYIAANGTSTDSTAANAYVVVAQTKDADLEWTGGNDSPLKAAANATAGDHKVELTLYKADANKKLTTKLDSLSLTFKVFNDADQNVTFSAVVDDIGTLKTGQKMYINATSGKTQGFKVYKTDSNGATVAVDNYWVNATNGLPNKSDDAKLIDGKIDPATLGLTEDGVAEVEIYVGDKVVTTCDLPYGVAAPYAAFAFAADNSGAELTNTEYTVTQFSATTGVLTFVVGGNNYTATVSSQYGEPVTTAVWSSNGKAVNNTPITQQGTYVVLTNTALGAFKLTLTIE